MIQIACLWCGTGFRPRATGGSPQRFCAAPCRRAFDMACRIYAAMEIDAGRLSVSTLRMALEQRARCLERGLGPRHPQAPGEPKTCDTGLHRPSAGKIECRPPAVEALADTLKRALKSEGSVY